jgi:outer membrane protein OmpA-like peptidoglycan-associated protein
MRKKYIFASILSLSLAGFSFAQDADNLVPNPSFEGTKGKLKNIKQITKATDWFSPTGLNADLFSADVSGAPISAPDNLYGKENPLEGKNYAGITAYSYNNKLPRTYLLTPLTAKLKKGQKYCVKYNVSLADLSKYAVNNLGAHLTKKAIEVDGKKDIIFSEKEIIIKTATNRIYDARYNWETVCGEYESEGNETYLVIGNFNESKETKYTKLKKAKDLKGSQLPMAYYYIDEVSVKLLSDDEKCSCEVGEEEELERVIYRKNSNSMEELSDADKVASATIYFDHLKSSLEADAERDVDVLAGILIDNPSYKIKIQAHSTNDEMEEAEKNDFHANLAKRRIDFFLEYCKSHGLEEDRFTTDIQDDLKPASNEDTLLGDAKNRRVEFKLVN